MLFKEDPYVSHLEVMGFAFSMAVISATLAFLFGILAGISTMFSNFPIFLYALASSILVMSIISFIGGAIFAIIYNWSSSRYHWVRFRASTSAK
jgi:hypothetical protein